MASRTFYSWRRLELRILETVMANTGEFTNNGDAAISGARDALGNVVREAKKLSAHVMDDAKAKTDKMATAVEKQGRAAMSNLQHTVQEKPALSVGIAIGAGVLLGLLFSARR